MRIFLSLLLSLWVTGVQAGQVSVHVPGMVCQMCVQGMRKAFKDVVTTPDKDITVDLEAKMVHLNLKSTLNDDEIKKRIRSTGYKAKSIERKKKSDKKTNT